MELDWFVIGNYIEAAVWGAMAVGLAVYGVRLSGKARWRCFSAALMLVLFGMSDVVEVETGAWWRPWWLLWKAGCVVGLGMVVVLEAVERKRIRGCRRGVGGE